jgi:hypothetical protein
MRLDPHRFTRVRPTARDGAVKNPGVAALQRSLFAFSQTDGFHNRYCRGLDGIY